MKPVPVPPSPVAPCASIVTTLGSAFCAIPETEVGLRFSASGSPEAVTVVEVPSSRPAAQKPMPPPTPPATSAAARTAAIRPPLRFLGGPPGAPQGSPPLPWGGGVPQPPPAEPCGVA